jgi:hypothetical protein
MFCYECGRERPASHPEAFSLAHKAEESRRRLAKLAATPMSMPITVMRKQSAPAPVPRPMSLTPAQLEARAAVLADRTPKERAEVALRAGRAMAVTAPRGTMSVREAEAALSGVRTAEQTQRLLDAEIDDMVLRSRGLTP